MEMKKLHRFSFVNYMSMQNTASAFTRAPTRMRNGIMIGPSMNDAALKQGR